MSNIEYILRVTNDEVAGDTVCMLIDESGNQRRLELASGFVASIFHGQRLAMYPSVPGDSTLSVRVVLE